MGLFWNFFFAVITHWYAAATGGLFVLAQLLQWVWPTGKKWIDDRWPVPKRRPVEVIALVGLLIFATFETFKDEHAARAQAEASLKSSNWWASYWKSEATRRSIVQSRKSSRDIAPPPEHLVHSLETSGPTLAIWGNQESGQHAVEGSDIRSFVLAKLYLDLTNHSEDLLTWRFKSVRISSGNRIFYRSMNETRALLPAMKSAKIERDGNVSIPFTPDINSVQLTYDIEYDTVPSTGVRRTGKTVDYAVEWWLPDGYHVKAPRLKMTILSERED